MDLDLTPEQQALRAELREYFARLISTQDREFLTGGARGEVYKDIVRQLGADGWLGVGWPKEYGGQGRTPVEQLIFYDEAERARAPIPFITLNTIGPTLMEHGTPEQKDLFLPRILAGEVHFAIGYTEPEAGTDLASLRTRAVREGECYVVNGNKIFTSGADDADYVWLAARTDPDAPRHKGISILIVDTSLPGFKVTPIHTISGGTTTATYYEDVRVPVEMRVGAENEGWRLITMQLNHERVALANAGRPARFLDDVVAWARDTEAAEGGRVIDRPWVQLLLARVHAELEALRLFNRRVASGVEHGGVGPADASAMKVYGSEFYLRAYTALLEVLQEAGPLRAGSPGAVLGGRIEQAWRNALILTFGGGVNEIQREIIAMAGLGMPRAPR